MKKIFLFAMLAILFTGCAQTPSARLESSENILSSETIAAETTEITSQTAESETSVIISETENTSSNSAATSAVTAATAAASNTAAPQTTPSAAAIPPQTTPAPRKAPAVTTSPAATQKVTSPPVTTAPAVTSTTPAKTAATTASVPPSSSASFQQQVADLVNAERAKAGLNPLTVSLEIQNAAQVRAAEIITSFSHTRPNGTSCFTALNEQGVQYKSSGENIAAGQASPADVMNSWMNSTGHRANILNAGFTHIGVGYIEGGGYRTNWVQLFAKL